MKRTVKRRRPVRADSPFPGGYVDALKALLEQNANVLRAVGQVSQDVREVKINVESAQLVDRVQETQLNRLEATLRNIESMTRALRDTAMPKPPQPKRRWWQW